MAVLVVACTLFGVGEDLVSLVNLLKLLDKRGVIGMEVGVTFPRFFSVSLFYFVFGRTLLDAEDLVLISFFFSHNKLRSVIE